MASLKTRKVSSQILSLTLEFPLRPTSSLGLFILSLPLSPLSLLLTLIRTHSHLHSHALARTVMSSPSPCSRMLLPQFFTTFFLARPRPLFYFVCHDLVRKTTTFRYFQTSGVKTIFNPIALNVYFWCNVKAQQLLQILALA